MPVQTTQRASKAVSSTGSPLRAVLCLLLSLGTSRKIEGGFTTEPASYCALRHWIGPTLSKFVDGLNVRTLMDYLTSVRKCLRSGEIVVSGDQWPSFLYEEEKINPDNPWDGLLRGVLLVSVRLRPW